MNLVGRWRVEVVLVLVPLAVAAVVLALLAGNGQGGLLWLAFALVVAGALVFLGSAAHGRYAWAGLGALTVAAVVSGWVVWSTPTFEETTRATQLVGAGAPSVLTAASWLLTVLVVLLGAVTMLQRTEFAGIPGQVWCALLAVAMLVAGVLGTGVWLGGRGLAALRTDAIAESTVDHTVAAADAPNVTRADTVTSPANWRKLWQKPAAQTVVGTFPRPLVVTADVDAGDQSGITVYDSRTGAERWHWHSRLFYDGSVAVSPYGDILVVVGSSAIELDLNSGAERRRPTLPAPSQPTLGQVRYRVVGPHLHDLSNDNDLPLIEMVDTFAPVVVRGGHGQTDLLAVSLDDRTVTTLAAGLPQLCRFRSVLPDEYTNTVNGSTNWLLRDGIGCGAPMLTTLFDGVPQSWTPAAPACDLHGCELVDAYATPDHVVVQTATELLTYDRYGLPQAHTPLDPNRRSVILPKTPTPTLLPPGAIPRKNTVVARDGASYVRFRATGDNSGQLVTVDTATGTESPPSETLPCAEPTDMTIAADTLILQCGSTMMAFG